MSAADDPDLDSAYALDGPAAARRLYADWANTYDSGFASDEDYRLHLHVAAAFVALGGHGPVLDVGAGTGLCGVALAEAGLSPIDATDISEDMLVMAERKDVYRDLIVADLTEGLPVADSAYAGFVSSGTFTHGHVGPSVLPELLRIGQPDALYALSVNAEHFERAGFKAMLTDLEPVIRDVSRHYVDIYGPNASGPHKADRAAIVTFFKR